jgi:hypothetical protein
MFVCGGEGILFQRTNLSVSTLMNCAKTNQYKWSMLPTSTTKTIKEWELSGVRPCTNRTKNQMIYPHQITEQTMMYTKTNKYKWSILPTSVTKIIKELEPNGVRPCTTRKRNKRTYSYRTPSNSEASWDSNCIWINKYVQFKVADL